MSSFSSVPHTYDYHLLHAKMNFFSEADPSRLQADSWEQR